MLQKSVCYARYWRDSLADADIGQGSFKKDDLSEHLSRPLAEFSSGRLDADTTRSLFATEPEQMKLVPVILRPYAFACHLNHGKRNASGLPEIVTPVVVKAVVDRHGRIIPLEHTVIPRDLLEPLDRGSLSVGALDDLDVWLTKNPHPQFDLVSDDPEIEKKFDQAWAAYLTFVSSIVTDVTGNWPAAGDPYFKSNHWYLIKEDHGGGVSFHILALYDHLLQSKREAPLFDRFASEDELAAEDCVPSASGFSQRLGHASDRYPLADAQRDAMTHHLASKRGEILGVNGPPGSGKTTLLLSIVASHMVQSAIAGGAPTVIAAASTNNQAVTNIIDAFAKDFSRGTGPFAGRWLPDITSFGAYFPAASKEAQAATKYQTRSFFNQIEDAPYFARAKATYLSAAEIAYPGMVAPTVEIVVDKLRQDLQSLENTLKTIEASWNAVLSTQQSAVAFLGTDPHRGLIELKTRVAGATSALTHAKSAKEEWEAILDDEKWWMTIFSFLGAVASRRHISAAIQFRKAGYEVPDNCRDVETVMGALGKDILRCDALLVRLQSELRMCSAVLAEYDLAIATWHADVEPVMGRVKTGQLVSLDDCDRVADTKIRFQAFLLATHYWEGRWLQAIAALLPTLADERTRNGESAVKPRWLRRMMVTPCMVSTFYMLPSEMKICRYNASTGFNPDYLYEFIDLLIVDEAGQVLPEVAGASFALAKTSLVIGDTLQLEPIWSTTPKVDIGNLLSRKLLDSSRIQPDYNRLCRIGKTSAAGSVMRIAQCASRYHYDRDLARGMFLYEHRRCYDEIISYCNSLCYQSKLLPMRGAAPGNAPLPAMGYLRIDGNCTKTSGGSRRNQLEADMIADWIVQNKRRLEALYKGTEYSELHQIVGVVTPFGGQVAAITEACAGKGLAVGKGDGEMTVGTVHSLQGAERPIVIFSPTYSKTGDGPFIDKRHSMLNVAVSRAKDSFLVFGDMDIFDPSDTGRPRGLLAKYLLASPDNALPNPTRGVGA